MTVLSLSLSLSLSIKFDIILKKYRYKKME